jgi:hypothetical protein
MQEAVLPIVTLCLVSVVALRQVPARGRLAGLCVLLVAVVGVILAKAGAGTKGENPEVARLAGALRGWQARGGWLQVHAPRDPALLQALALAADFTLAGEELPSLSADETLLISAADDSEFCRLVRLAETGPQRTVLWGPGPGLDCLVLPVLRAWYNGSAGQLKYE